MKNEWRVLLAALLVGTVGTLAPTTADAFCGAYVSGGSADLFNNATQVAMMRHKQTTVMSMQNNYEGPPKDFAMIVPVPQVLKKKNVKTIQESVFDRIDTITAPRLVEYWEQDPCGGYGRQFDSAAGAGGTADAAATAADAGGAEQPKVTVEAKFAVGEYDVVVLDSNDSTALTSWLKNNNYNIPNGADPYLQPYIQGDSYFFVAKVDADSDELTFKNGQAVLSPLRFNYESMDFKLPVRLGLINSKGKQDLIVNILGKGDRYNVSNYPTAYIPTNIEVVSKVKNYFPSFYRALFSETLRKNKKNGQNPVVTEYSWNAKTCDPCPTEPVSDSDMLTLGGDVLADKYSDVGTTDRGGENVRFGRDWVITRLHTRYGKNEIGKDIVFTKADPIIGGRGTPGRDELPQEPEDASRNNFQGRYIVKHHWDGAIDCEDPRTGRWGGKYGGAVGGTRTAKGETNSESDPSKQPDEVNLDEEIVKDIEPIQVTAKPKQQDDGIHWAGEDSTGSTSGGQTTGSLPSGGSGDPVSRGCSTGGSHLPVAPMAALFLFGLIGLLRHRRTLR